MSDESRCPLCREAFPKKGLLHAGTTKMYGMRSYREGFAIDCPRCGEFEISRLALVRLPKEAPSPRLCALTRQAFEAGSRWRLSREVVEREIERPASTVADKQRKLLEWIARQTNYPGMGIVLHGEDAWPVIDCENAKEFDWHVKEVKRRGLINSSLTDLSAEYAALTSEGWAALARDSGERVDPHRAFVAMSFADDLQPVWEQGFKPAIESAGYDAHRADSQPSTEAIDQKLIGDIRRSRFVIADVTHHRPNVYFEAGYALAMGKPVIWTVQEDHREDLHFDTRQFPHLVWKDSAHLAEQLENFVAGAIGRLERPDRPVERT